MEYQYTLLNKHLFNRIDGESGIVMSNVDKNIITEISLGIPYNYSGMISYKDNSAQDVACHFEREFFGINFCAEYPECGSRFILKRGVENFIKANYHLSTESEIDMLNGAYLHKKDISRIRIYGKPGYLLTLIYEDDYEYIIHDTYIAVSGGVIFSGNVFYKGDKDDVSFEELEGRRYYLKGSIDKMFSFADADYKKSKVVNDIDRGDY